MRTRLSIAVVATAAAGVLATSALAAPSATTIDSATRTGTTVIASGTATFDGAAPATAVGGTNTDFANPAVAAAAGVDLKEGLIEALPGGKGLRFTWKLASLPAQVPPEVARYTWAFGVGGKEYQLQAKRTNMAATTVADDVPGHAAQLSKNGFFQVRGNCGPLGGQEAATVTSCPHLAFLEGAFDATKGTVHVDLPFGTKAVPELVPGAIVKEAVVANISIGAGFSAVVSNTSTTDFTNGWQPYYVGPHVSVGTGSATAAGATNYAPATLTGSSWSGTVEKVPATHTKLFVRSCEGAASTCSVVTRPLG